MPAPQSIYPGLELDHSFAVSEEMMTAFARLSGDHHAVHHDDGYARTRGFKARIVYGGLLVAQVSRLVGAELPVRHCVWSRLTIDFRAPLYVGETASLRATIVNVAEAVGALSLRFEIAADGRAIARGTAEVIFSND